MDKKRHHVDDTIDLLDLAKKLIKYWWVMAAALVIGAVGAFGYTAKMVTPLYRAECMIYVNNGSITVGSTSVSLSDLNASQSLVDTYMVILESRKVLMDVADEMGVNYSYEKMKNMVSAGKISNTEVFSVYVTSPDPVEAETMANTIADVLPVKITDIIEGSSVKIVDYAVLPSQKISPNTKKNTMMGALALFVVAAGLLVLRILLDNTVQNETDIFPMTKLPILAKIADFSKKTGKNGKKRRKKYYGYKKDEEHNYSDHDHGFGAEVPFSAREAYRLLRTNIRYSLPASNKGKIVGITSSIASEFKSTTAINLAKSFAKEGNGGQKVLLLDCDLRMSEIASRLTIDKKVGLTEYLTSDIPLESIISKSEECPGLYIVISGGSSPNPGDLLNSEKMADCLKRLANAFDVIICDFPPANIVSDALDTGKYCDGMLLVVRENYTEKNAVEESLRKLEFLSLNVLGIVLTGAETESRYGRRNYYEKYYGKYGKYMENK